MSDRQGTVPLRCEQCIAEGSYYGVLHFPTMEKTPVCRHHTVVNEKGEVVVVPVTLTPPLRDSNRRPTSVVPIT